MKYSSKSDNYEQILSGCVYVFLELSFFPTLFWLAWTFFGIGYLFNFLPEFWQHPSFWVCVGVNFIFILIKKWFRQ